MMDHLLIGGDGFIGRNLRWNGIGDKIYDLKTGHDARDNHSLRTAMRNTHTIWHLASNADISLAADHPDLDFVHGTMVTRSILEAMRLEGKYKLVYFSGSGVYGDWGDLALHESHGPMRPCSTYGASKLAGEAMIHAYSRLFEWESLILRPANVVGPWMTHGVVHDFMHELVKGTDTLHVKGNGRQLKSYLHVADLIEGLKLLDVPQPPGTVRTFNVSARSTISVREIAEICREVAGSTCRISYELQRPGWPGDVPVVKLNSSKLAGLGWVPNRSLSQRELITEVATKFLKEIS